MMDRWIAYHWIGAPHAAKYRLSAWLAGANWHLPFSAVLAKHGIRLNGLTTLREIVDAFRGKVRWKPDPAWQMADVVLPPIQLLAAGGEDCDGSAMLMAQAVDHALGPLGWHGRILSYLAAPWAYSHHVAMAEAPDGLLWAIQPYPSADQPADLDPLVPRPFSSYPQAAREIASWYGARVVAFDVRDANWIPVQPWQPMETSHMAPSPTKQLEHRLTARVSLIAAGLGIAATLATGMATWGDLGARVRQVEREVQTKADAATVADLKADVREVRQRVDRVLSILGGDNKR